jgi:chemotaxis protein MotA
MATLILGLVLSVGIMVGAFLNARTGIQALMNWEGLIIVLGGTLSILFLSIRKEQFVFLLREMVRLPFSPRAASHRKVREVLLRITLVLQNGGKLPKNAQEHAFLSRALGWLDGGLRGESLEKLLHDGASLDVARLRRCADILQNLSKYPPALGMIGTVFGIISIFNGLGDAAGQQALGRNLAFAMTATLYGLVTMNFWVSPLAELMEQEALELELELSLIVETVKLWSENESPLLIREQIELFHAA